MWTEVLIYRILQQLRSNFPYIQYWGLSPIKLTTIALLWPNYVSILFKYIKLTISVAFTGLGARGFHHWLPQCCQLKWIKPFILFNIIHLLFYFIFKYITPTTIILINSQIPCQFWITNLNTFSHQYNQTSSCQIISFHTNHIFFWVKPR